MAKLHFFYSVMNAGKTTSLLQVRYNYEQNGGKCLVITHASDNRVKEGVVWSRLIKENIPALALDKVDPAKIIEDFRNEHGKNPVAILVDECQFFDKESIKAFSDIVDEYNVPVMCYGLKVDSNANLFPGSEALLIWAEDVKEIKQVCHCGKKATHILRFNTKGEVLKNAPQIQVGSESSYVSVCRRCYKAGDIGFLAQSIINKGD
jgi:thymidine kinase